MRDRALAAGIPAVWWTSATIAIVYIDKYIHVHTYLYNTCMSNIYTHIDRRRGMYVDI